MGDSQVASSTPAPTASTAMTKPVTNPEDSTQMLLREAVLARHSSRVYLDKPVPRALLENALGLARHAASDSNTQVWRYFIVTGEMLVKLKDALFETASNDPNADFAPLPPEFKPYRSALGAKIFGEAYGLDRGMQRHVVLLNYKFFGAPVGIIVCMSKELADGAAMGVGMYMQTFMLALTELGVNSCAQASIAQYPEVVRKVLGIPDGLKVLCGMAVGYEDPDSEVNKVASGREPVNKTTVWLE
ncbi:Nitroreductase-like protein [Xylaria intraflava]|nr:Nitroreductase-like protein [Xylaria intraflava]